MSDDRRDIERLFRADISRIDLPPAPLWFPETDRRQPVRWSGLLAIPAAIGVIALAIVLALVIQLARGQLPSGVASSPTPVTPGTAIPATPLPSATVKPLSQLDPVRIHSTLPAEGQWALVLGWSPIGDWTSSVVAVPLSGQSKDAIQLISFTTSGNREWANPSNLMRVQLSPDKHRLVLSMTVKDGTFARLGLVIVDLVAGTFTTITSDKAYHDVSPAWSPNGDDIAFLRLGSTPGRQSPNGPLYALPDAGVWMMRADGTGLRRVLGPPAELPNLVSSTALYGWNANGTALGFSQGSGRALEYKLLEVAGGTVTQMGMHGASWTITRGGGDWRDGQSAFVGATVDLPAGSPSHIDVADSQLGAGARSVVDGPSDLNANFQYARWRPGSNDVLYVRYVFDTSAEQRRTGTLFVTDATGRKPLQIRSISPARLLAEWTPDGRDVAWVEALDLAAAVHLIRPDGTNDRFLASFAATPGSRTDWIDLAVLGF